MSNQSVIACPKWINDEALIKTLLNAFLDKIDRNVKPGLRVTAKTAPQLFDYNGEDTAYLWSLVERLQNEFNIVSITSQRSSARHEVHENAQLRFNTEQEALVRQWLKREKYIPYAKLWRTAIDRCDELSNEQANFLYSNIIQYPHKSAEQLIDSLIQLRNALQSPATLRTLSAQCFWGDSKFLDKREEWIALLFPEYATNIKPRRLLINVFIPKHFTGVLFVENQETFLSLIDCVENSGPKHIITDNATSENSIFKHVASKNTVSDLSPSLNQLALVYSAGFRGTATKSRELGGVSFSHLGAPGPTACNNFERWWLNNQAQSLNSYFWGDLDFSAMAILKALRKTFADVQAWQPGYQAMLTYYDRGIVHSAKSTHKQGQQDPGNVGCQYCDNKLLPLLRQTQHFLDQEVVDIFHHFS